MSVQSEQIEIQRRRGFSIGSLGCWKYPEHVSCVEFVEKHGIVPSGARRGGLSFDHRPYQRGVYAIYDDESVRTVTLLWCSQSGKSTTGLNILQYHVCTRPTASMVVMPDKKSRNDFVEDRLRRAIMASPRWRRELLTGDILEDVIQNKARFRNAPIYLALAGSESDMASRDCELVMLDEKDKPQFARKTDREGSADDQVSARTRTFPNPKHVNISTPTNHTGAIWNDYKRSDMRRWYISCPKCGTEQPWELRNLKRSARPKDKAGRKRKHEIHASLISSGDVRVWYEFPCCQHCIDTKIEKDKLNRNGRWIAERPEVRDHAGFRITAFDIPDESFHSIMREYLIAQGMEEGGDDRKIAHFFRHWLALPYRPRHMRQGVDAIQARVWKRYRRGMVPAGTDFVTLAIDVQGEANGIYWMSVAWRFGGPKMHVIDWGHIAGEFERIEEQIDDVVNRRWEWERIANAPVRSEEALVVYLDSGDGKMVLRVYEYCLRFDGGRVRPIKGGLPGDDFYRVSGKPDQPHGGLLVHLNSVLLKDAFSSWFVRKPEDPHAVTFPLEVMDDIDLQEQLVSEERSEKSGRVVYTATGPNHYYDALIYNVGGAIASGIFQDSPGEDAGDPRIAPRDIDEERDSWVRSGRRGGGWIRRSR